MIELEGIAKVYHTRRGLRRQEVRALDGVTLRVSAGETLGIVGLNGAGKSTLLRVLLGYVHPTSGQARIDGETPRRYAERHGVAYVPERVAIPRAWTVRGALEAYAMLGNLGDDAHQRVDAALDRLGLVELAARRVATLSKGNLQRLAIAQTLLGERRVMVLDEPTDGLDPLWIVRLREIVAEWRAAEPGRVVVLASHNLAEVERLADRVVALHRGRVREEIDFGGPGGARGELERRFLEMVERWEVVA